MLLRNLILRLEDMKQVYNMLSELGVIKELLTLKGWLQIHCHGYGGLPSGGDIETITMGMDLEDVVQKIRYSFGLLMQEGFSFDQRVNHFVLVGYFIHLIISLWWVISLT